MTPCVERLVRGASRACSRLMRASPPGGPGKLGIPQFALRGYLQCRDAFTDFPVYNRMTTDALLAHLALLTGEEVRT